MKPHTPHTPPVLRTQHSNTTTRRRSGQNNTRECNAKGTGQCGVPDLIRRQGTPRRRRGQHKTRGNNTAHTTPAIQQDHHANGRGTARTRRGGQQHSRPSLTMPPTIRYGTPPSTTAPPTTTTRGEQTEDTPPHEHHRHTLTTHTPQHLAKNSTQHDSSTRQHCNGMSRARATPPHRAGQQHTPPPFHTPRRMDTIHSSTHPLSHCSRSHNQRTIMINEQ